jgi:hypothetical protein
MQTSCRNVEGLGGSSSCTLVARFYDRLIEAISWLSQAKPQTDSGPAASNDDLSSFNETLTEFVSVRLLPFVDSARADQYLISCMMDGL